MSDRKFENSGQDRHFKFQEFCVGRRVVSQTTTFSIQAGRSAEQTHTKSSTSREINKMLGLRTRSQALALLIGVAFLILQFVISSSLARTARHISNTIDEDDDNGNGDSRVNLQALLSVLAMGRLWSGLASLVALSLVVGAWKVRQALRGDRVNCIDCTDHDMCSQEALPFVRFGTLFSFVTLFGELLLLSLLSYLFGSASSGSSSRESFCEILTNAEFSVGWSVESCEEEFSSLLFGVALFLGTLFLLRIWACLQLVNYHTELGKRGKRKLDHLNTRDYRVLGEGSSSSKDSLSAGGKRSSSSPATGRIFLLPGPYNPLSSSHSPSTPTPMTDIPLVSLTPSSPPSRTAFPPVPFSSSPTSATSSSTEATYLVYAPVLMTESQARKLHAKEIVIDKGSHHRTRSRTISYPPPSTPTGLSLSLLGVEEQADDSEDNKGKRS